MADLNNQQPNQNFQNQPPMGYPPPPPPPQPPKDNKKTMAIIGMICGIVSIVFFCVPYFSIPCSIGGIVLGAIGLKSSGKGMAIAGIVCGSIGLVIAVVFIILILAAGISTEMLNSYYY